MTFEEFRDWALESTRAAARRWEKPDNPETQILLAVDDYGARHLIPVPPIYLKEERGHVYWLRTLPVIANNRSLRFLAYRASTWGTVDPTFADAPVDDPSRFELLTLNVAGKDRYEIWSATIVRLSEGLPTISEWKGHTSQQYEFRGAIPKHLRAALDGRQGLRGPTMPAADMVLSPLDLPDDFFLFEDRSGPVDKALNATLSSYHAVNAPRTPWVQSISQAMVFPSSAAAEEETHGQAQVLVEDANPEFDGPPLGDESHYFGGMFNGSHVHRFTVNWRYAEAFCQLTLTGPPGHWTRAQVFEYVARQDRRARVALSSMRLAVK